MTTSSEHTQLTLFTTDKTCTQCGETKPLTDYYAHKTNRDGRQGKCKNCIRANRRAWREANLERDLASKRAWREANPERQRANNRAWYAANPERRRAHTRAWQKANPERHLANNRAAKHRRRARKHFAVPQRWTRNECPDHLCYWCGTTLTPDTTHIDHIMPLALHGPDTPNNRAHTCAACNLSKGGTHPLVWIAHLVTNN